MIEESANSNELKPLAIARIRELQRRLKDEYGLKVRCGAELEFFVVDAKGKSVPLDVAAIKKQFSNSPYVEDFHIEGAIYPPLANAAGYALGLALGTIPDNGALGLSLGLALGHLISGKYKDGGLARATLGSKMHKYEFIIGKGMGKYKTPLGTQAGGVPDKTKPLDFDSARLEPLRIAEATDAIKRGIVRHMEEHPEMRAVFSPSLPDDPMTAGLHLNISLTDESMKNLFYQSPELMHHCARELVEVQNEAALVMLPQQESYDRLNAKKQHPISRGKTMQRLRSNYSLAMEHESNFATQAYSALRGKRLKPEHTHLENRMPGADADVYLGMAATLGAVYHALERHTQMEHGKLQVEPFVEDKAPDYKVPATLEESLERFERSTLAREVLGEELHHAVLTHHLQHSHLHESGTHIR